MTNPTFSVVTITRDNFKGLEKTYLSLKDQSFQNYEWIVIDGNSTDGTQKYLEQTNAQWISESDNGIYDAMNKGIDRAKGHYIIFMNAGDCFADSEILDLVAEKTSTEKPDFIYGDALEFSKSNFLYKKSRSHEKIHQSMFTHHQSMIYARHLFDGNRYDTGYNIAADYDVTLRALKKAQNTLYIPLPICVFESGGISQQQVLQGRKEQFSIRQKHGITAVNNMFIFLAQSGLYRCRQMFPSLYWKLKRR